MKDFSTLEIYKDGQLVHTQQAHFSVIYRLLFQWNYLNSPYTVKITKAGGLIDFAKAPSLTEDSAKLSRRWDNA